MSWCLSLSVWDQSGITLGSLWNHSGIILGTLWGHSGNTLISLWISWGYLWEHYGIILVGAYFQSFSEHQQTYKKNILSILWETAF